MTATTPSPTTTPGATTTPGGGAPVDFRLPPDRAATEPPEARGVARDATRLLVATAERLRHTTFRLIGAHLRAGDLVVVNTSATLPAAVDGRRHDGREVVVHLAGPHPVGDDTWIVELRLPDGSGPALDGRVAEVVTLTGGAELHLLAPHPRAERGGTRRWRAALPMEAPVDRYLAAHGRPITYGYVTGRWPLTAYQPVFAREPGSAEMVSAARPFSHELVTDLVARGVTMAPVVLHTGLSSSEDDDPPAPERFRVPQATARLVEHTRRHGGRVVAVGTTTTRALESALAPDGTVRAAGGWTGLVLDAARPARVVDGLVTGWHAPGASHLRLLEAVAGHDLVRRAYDAALAGDYLWHELGDSALLLP